MVKPGDAVMVGPVEVLIDNSTTHFNGLKPGTNWVSAFMAEHAYPWSPALPAVSRWLAETPDASWLLMALDSGADAIDGNLITDRALGLKRDLNGPKNRDLLRSLASAIRAALTGGEGAGGD